MRKILFKTQYDPGRTIALFVMSAGVILFLPSCFCQAGISSQRQSIHRSERTIAPGNNLKQVDQPNDGEEPVSAKGN